MPDIVDLKRTPQDKKEIEEDFNRSYTEADYPYGLELSLEDVEIEKLGAEGFDVGDEVTITGTAIVTRKNSRQVQGGKDDKSMGIQITGLSLSKGSTKSAAETLYGGNGNDNNAG